MGRACHTDASVSVGTPRMTPHMCESWVDRKERMRSGKHCGGGRAALSPRERACYVFLIVIGISGGLIALTMGLKFRSWAGLGHMALGFAVLAQAIMRAVSLRSDYRRQRRRKEGRCLDCGYDLAGNVSGVCPECGTPTTESANKRGGSRA